MDALSESDLIDAIRNKAVQRFEIVQTSNGGYRIIVNVSKISISSTWKEGDLELITSRNEPREWASLDRLVKHIRLKYGPVPVIKLTLAECTPEEPNEDSDRLEESGANM